ncbi:protein SCAI isoform X2 [Poecile atricapillus]|uniref:protein SCAI isoform X2 n=1 Tax=Poecile atricapillus TaxID=48891 RepID=UPI00273900D9|nr:protein SCAI isoform X2 [Poecile atricapillus]
MTGREARLAPGSGAVAPREPLGAAAAAPALALSRPPEPGQSAAGVPALAEVRHSYTDSVGDVMAGGAGGAAAARRSRGRALRAGGRAGRTDRWTEGPVSFRTVPPPPYPSSRPPQRQPEGGRSLSIDGRCSQSKRLLTVSLGVRPIRRARGRGWPARTGARRQPRSPNLSGAAAAPGPGPCSGPAGVDGDRGRPAAPAPLRPGLQLSLENLSQKTANHREVETCVMTELPIKEIMSSGGAEDDIPQAERKTVTDFCYLLDKSKQLFNGLRDLPQYGQKQWQSYFGRTFDVYTKLWKFQQQHRQVLDNRYGLKRWQIGEIASKIGQLYYHYYLRTSETSYLNEAFSFYSAIRQRSYYSQVNKEDRPELVVKKLRYYARFIVVCLLLNKMDVVKDLVKELSDEIEDYTHRFNTEDQVEWNLVLQEVAAFIEADPVMVLNDDNTIVITSNRLSETGAPLLEQGMIVGQLALADALIIGNCNNQVKFSELTIDMFRMLQALEREPMNLASQMNKPGMQESTEKPARRENPHKYLLYKPTFSQLYTFLAASFKELPANSVLLIYLSATGVFPSGRSDSEGPYDFGGVLTNSNRDIINGDAIHKRNQSYKEMHCLHPGDLYPFTRKPLFIIVDSSNSVAYKNFTNLFGQPLVCLLSPTAYPKALQDQSQRGSLFTLFLNNPLMAFLFVSGLSSMRRGLWEKCQDYLRKINRDIAQLLTHSRSIDQSFLQFFGDEFLRLLLTRFIFCSATMRMHKIFRQETRNYPESYPQLPRDETVENPHLQKHILELASILDVRNVFLENTLDDY